MTFASNLSRTTSFPMRLTSGSASVRLRQYRDHDEQFSNVGKGGNFYLKMNGKDFLVRGGVYTPDLLYRYDPDREAAVCAT